MSIYVVAVKFPIFIIVLVVLWIQNDLILDMFRYIGDWTCA